MKMRNRIASAAGLLLFLPAPWPLSLGQALPRQEPSNASAPAQAISGVVVESVAPNSAAGKAGIQERDVLLSWSQADSAGQIASPFDVSQIEIEQGPRGAVTLEGLRGPVRQAWTLRAGNWGLKTRPNLPAKIRSLYEQGQALAKAGKLTQAAERWRTAAQNPGTPKPSWLHVWLLSHVADVFTQANQWKDADVAYESALQQVGATGAIKLQLLRTWAKSYELRSDWANAEKRYRECSEESAKSGTDSLMFADALDGIALAAIRHGDLDESEKDYSQALEIQQKLAPNSLSMATSVNGLGNVAQLRGDLDKSEEYHRKALAIREQLAPGSLDVAASLNVLGLDFRHRGDLDQAEKFYRRALEIRQQLAPDSLDVAAVLNNLGVVAYNRGDVATAEDDYKKSLAIKEKLAPDSLDVPKTLKNLGLLAQERGNLHDAEEYFLRGLAMEEKLAPGSLDVALSLGNLGLLAFDRGDLLKAEEYHHKALALEEKLAPEGRDRAGSLTNLGIVAWYRGNLEKAEEYYQRALILLQKTAPESGLVADVLDDLGHVARDRNDLQKAEQYYRQAMAIEEKTVVPGSLAYAKSLTNLGNVAQDSGDLTKAEEYLLRSLEIAQKTAPGGLVAAEDLNSLGTVVADRGDFDKAQKYYQGALEIREKVSPGSKDYAETLAALAGVMSRKGQLDAAAPLFEQALDALDRQTAHLGGSDEARSSFRARYVGYYQNYIDLLIRQKHPEAAFQVLERSRARTLLEVLASAHVNIRKGIAPVLLDQEQSLGAEFAAKTNRRIRLLSDKHTEQQVAAVNQEIEKLLARRKDVEEQIRASSPGYAALIQPTPLSAREVQQQLLEDNTLLLAYSLGEERSYVFAVTPGSLNAYELPKRSEIEAAALHVYDLVSARNRPVDRELRPFLDGRATEYGKAATTLSEMVLGPVVAQLRQKRLVIVADGALQYVPFGALPMPAPGAQLASETQSPDRSGAVPLVAEHEELANLPAASVLAILRSEAGARKPAPKNLAVLADPVFSASDVRVNNGPAAQQHNDAVRSELEQKEKLSASNEASENLTRSANDLGLATGSGGPYLPRLPFSRREAMAILSLVPAGQGMKALDFNASRATVTGPELAHYRIVHFATHGLLDNEHPELSGLVLSLVDDHGKPENGFLDLEDIYNLNLSADLVVLSACETGLGKQIRGEGLVGLTRGFMYAGATRVVASLWSVDDEATKELMTRFYKAMEQQGMSPAQALRQAQVAMMERGRWHDPYYWAGFVLQGEWK
jgi:CHAT domain-containing protein/Tfp pilus assembly protein PilF